jgi:phage major head subunit gpT-like protein
MPWAPSNLATKGALASFHQAMEAAPSIWSNHVQTIMSTSTSETLVFPGFLPNPREFLGSRQFQDARDFTYTVTNKEYELSMVIGRKAWEDDQTGLINARLSEMGEVWGSWKDSLFSTLLASGNVSGNNGFDGVTFHSDDHSAGTTGLTTDNNLSQAAATGTVFTVAEFQTAVDTVRQSFQAFTDDVGRPYNAQALTNLRVIVHPTQSKSSWEAVNQTAFTGGSGATNEWGNASIQGIDVNLYQASGDSDELYFSALGSVRKPFIYQERTPLEIIIKAGAEDVAENNGVLVLTRQRYVLTYGDPRRSILMTAT